MKKALALFLAAALAFCITPTMSASEAPGENTLQTDSETVETPVVTPEEAPPEQDAEESLESETEELIVPEIKDVVDPETEEETPVSPAAEAAAVMSAAEAELLAAATFTVTGTVTDQDENPLADVEVKFMDNKNSSVSYTGTTDASGVYEIAGLPKGQYFVSTDQDDYTTFPNAVTVDFDRTNFDITLTIKPVFTITGTVTDQDGNPLAGVDVRAYARSPVVSISDTTDENGMYELAGLTWRTYELSAYKEGYVSYSIVTPVDPDQTTFDIVLSPASSHTVTGTVKDQHGTPLEGAEVVFEFDFGDYSATTDASGGYVIEELPTGDYTYRVRKSGYRSNVEQVTVEAGRTVFDGVLTSTHTVTGTVTDQNGNPVAGIEIFVSPVGSSSGFVALTDALGKYEAPGTVEGDSTFSIFELGYVSYEEIFTIGPDNTKVDIILTAVPLHTAVVTVKDQNGNPLTNVTVDFDNTSENGPSAYAYAEQAGKYTTDELPDGNYTLRIYKLNYTYYEEVVTFDSGHTKFAITLNETGPAVPSGNALLQKVAGIPVGKLTFVGVSDWNGNIYEADPVTVPYSKASISASDFTSTGEWVELYSDSDFENLEKGSIDLPAGETTTVYVLTFDEIGYSVFYIVPITRPASPPPPAPPSAPSAPKPAPASNRGSSSGSGGTTYTPSTRASAPVPNAPVTVTAAMATTSVNAAVTAARATNATTATAVLKNPGEISLAILTSMANQAGDAALKLNADSMLGTAVDVRLTLSPSQSTANLNLSGSTQNSTAKSVRSLFERHFSNQLMIIALGQQGSFGQPVEVAAKLDPALDSANLTFYTYNAATNTFAPIAAPAYWVDQNGYVHFTTTVGGTIVISKGSLTK